MYHKYSAIDLVVWNGIICYFGGIKTFVDPEDEVRLVTEHEKQIHKKANHA